jgi:hypothetical protein
MRRLTALILIAAASIGLAACVGTHDPMPGRELDCGRLTLHDLCVRVADLAMSDEAGLDRDVRGWQMTVKVNANDCSAIARGPDATRHPPASRCWRVQGDVPALSYSFGRWVYENQDGSLGVTG